EVYPALWSRGFARKGRTGDQHDAYSVAAWLSRADHDGSLAAFLKPDLTPPERIKAEVEGWDIRRGRGGARRLILDRGQAHKCRIAFAAGDGIRQRVVRGEGA